MIDPARKLGAITRYCRRQAIMALRAADEQAAIARAFGRYPTLALARAAGVALARLTRLYASRTQAARTGTASECRR